MSQGKIGKAVLTVLSLPLVIAPQLLAAGEEELTGGYGFASGRSEIISDLSPRCTTKMLVICARPRYVWAESAVGWIDLGGTPPDTVPPFGDTMPVPSIWKRTGPIPNIPDYFDAVSRHKFRFNDTVNFFCNDTGGVHKFIEVDCHAPNTLVGTDASYQNFFHKVIEKVDPYIDFSDPKYCPSDTVPNKVRVIIQTTCCSGGWELVDDTLLKEVRPNGDTVDVVVEGALVMRLGAYVVSPSRHDTTWNPLRPWDAVHIAVGELGHNWLPDVDHYIPSSDVGNRGGPSFDHSAMGSFDVEELPGRGGFLNPDTRADYRPSFAAPQFCGELGWIPGPIRPVGEHCDVPLSDYYTNGTVYRLAQGPDTLQSQTAEFFDVTCHMRYGESTYEEYWPGRGVLVWHVQPPTRQSVTFSRDSIQKRWWRYFRKPIDLECAHGRWDWSDTTNVFPPLGHPVAENPESGRDSLDVRCVYARDSMVNPYYGEGSVSCFFSPFSGLTRFDARTNPSSDFLLSYETDTLRDCLPSHAAVLNVRGDLDLLRADLSSNYVPSPFWNFLANSSQRKFIADPRSSARAFHMVYTSNRKLAVPAFTVYYGRSTFPDSGWHDGFVVGQGNHPSAAFSPGSNSICVAWLDGEDVMYRRKEWWEPAVTLFNGDPALDSPQPPAIAVDGNETAHVFSYLAPVTSSPPKGAKSLYPLRHLWFPEHCDSTTTARSEDVAFYSFDPADPYYPRYSVVCDSQSGVHLVYEVKLDTSYRGVKLMYRYKPCPGDTWYSPAYAFPVLLATKRWEAPFLDLQGDTLYLVAVGSTQGARSEIYYAKKPVDPGVPWYSLPGDTFNVSKTPYNESREPQVAGRAHVVWQEDVGSGNWDIYYNQFPFPTQTCRNKSNTLAYSGSPNIAYQVLPGGSARLGIEWAEGSASPYEAWFDTVVVFGRTGGAQSAGAPRTMREPVLCTPLPNPSVGAFSVEYVLPDSVFAELCVFNSAGMLVKTLTRGKQGEGSHRVHWDGTDARGSKTGAGVYFLQLRTPEKVITRKAVLVR